MKSMPIGRKKVSFCLEEEKEVDPIEQRSELEKKRNKFLKEQSKLWEEEIDDDVAPI